MDAPNACLWCDDPCEGENKLCPSCKAVNDHPLFHCSNPRHTVPTLGPSCADCDFERAHAARREAINAPIRASLEAILAGHVRDWHKPWPGCEFGKTIIGNALLAAIKAVS
jgi:hypothetical protein